MLKNWVSNTVNGAPSTGGITVDNLLLEDGFNMLQEDGSLILL